MTDPLLKDCQEALDHFRAKVLPRAPALAARRFEHLCDCFERGDRRALFGVMHSINEGENGCQMRPERPGFNLDHYNAVFALARLSVYAHQVLLAVENRGDFYYFALNPHLSTSEAK